MSKLTTALSYAYDRNIGWQDRTLRTVAGVAAAAGAVYFWPERPLYTALLGVLAVAQAGTVLSARCILCYLADACTIDSRERSRLGSRGIPYEGQSPIRTR